MSGGRSGQTLLPQRHSSISNTTAIEHVVAISQLILFYFYFFINQNVIDGMEKTSTNRTVSWKIMRFTGLQMILMTIFAAMVFAHETKSQDILNKQVTIRVEAVEIKKLLNDIERQTAAKFVYSNSTVKSSSKVSLHVVTERLSVVLDKVLPPLHISYEVMGERIILSKLESRTGQINEEVETLKKSALPAETLPVFTVSGTVVDAQNEPLIGASVVLEGTQKGAITDVNGSFKLNLEDSEKDGTLVVTLVGYEKQRVPIEGRTLINVVLKEGNALQEVVVLGYSTQKKADLTGSVATVDVDQMLTRPAADVSNMLQGRVAGVVASGSNQPGGNGYVRIRGIASFGLSDPLFIIDGVQTNNTNSLNPNDIESMSVLKDASSAAIYGARGAGGVIVITTKKGKPNQNRISYDSYYGISKLNNYPDMLNTQEYADLIWAQQKGAGIATNSPQFGRGATPVIPDYVLAGGASGLFEGNPAVDPSKYVYDQNGFYQIVKANKEGTDWFKEMTQVAPVQNHNLTASGGTDRSVYSISLGYYNEAGIQKYTYYDRYSVRANSEFKLFKWLRLGETIFGSFVRRQGSLDNNEGSPWSQAYRLTPFVPVYDIMGNFAGSKAGGAGNGQNPVAMLYRAKDNSDKDVRLLGSVYGEIDLLKGLKFRSNFGIDYINNYNKAFSHINPEHSEGTFNTNYATQSGYQYRWTFSNTLNYGVQLGKHDIHALVGVEAVAFQREQVGGNRNGYYPFTDQSFWVLDRGNPIGQGNFSSLTEEALASSFGRVDYVFNDKYLLNATVRRDGSSKFAEAVRYGIFPSVSVGWRVSQEPFMKNVRFISDLKFRAGYGEVGNDQIEANNQYSFYRSDPSRSFYDITGSNTSTVPGYDLDRKGNTLSKWESTTTINLGMDLSMFNNALEMNVDVYRRKTSDLLVQIPRPGTEGNFTAPFINVGNTENKGIDLLLTYRGKAIHNKLSYSLGINATTYRNKVLSDGVDFFTNAVRYGSVSRTLTNEAIGMFYGYVIDGFFNSVEEVMAAPTQPGINKSNTTAAAASVGRWRLKDLNSDGVINANDRQFIGSPHPKLQTGITLDVAFKNFDLNVFGFWNYGNQIYNNTKWWTDFNGFTGNRSKRMLYESWSPDNPNALLPRLDINDNISNSVPHTYYVESGSYFRLKTVQLGYTLPQSLMSKWHLGRLRLYVQGQNLFTITKYTGPDPDLLDVGRGDIGLGVDHGRVPNALQFIGGINLSF